MTAPQDNSWHLRCSWCDWKARSQSELAAHERKHEEEDRAPREVSEPKVYCGHGAGL